MARSWARRPSRPFARCTSRAWTRCLTSTCSRDLFPAQQHVARRDVEDVRQAGTASSAAHGDGQDVIGHGIRHTTMRPAAPQAGREWRQLPGLVLCPDHLVGKWCREIRETIPDATSCGSAPRATSKVAARRSGSSKGRKALSEETKTRQSAPRHPGPAPRAGPWPRRPLVGDEPEGLSSDVLGRNHWPSPLRAIGHAEPTVESVATGSATVDAGYRSPGSRKQSGQARWGRVVRPRSQSDPVAV